ncbi:MAG: hypothetical protein ACUVTG_07340 [Candidatus Oleimicrobiaceae bacterium]
MRQQPHAGRLDLLFQDVESNKRYEVEVQLGRTDEAHTIRTIEYWDIERKRYPQYEHTALIIAEDIPSRFLNVIGIFNGFIPLVAIQLRAMRPGDSISSVFTKVMDEMPLGLVEEDEEVQTVADRGYWEGRASKDTMAMMDEMFEVVRLIDHELELKYNKFHVGLAKNGQPDNFLIFRPKKDWLRVEVRLERSDELQPQHEESGLDVMDYSARSGRYRSRLIKGDVKKHKELLASLMRQAHTGKA